MTSPRYDWPVHLAILAILGGIRFSWQMPMSVCMGMTLPECLGLASAIVVIAGLTLTTARGLWLARRSRNAVRALSLTPIPPALRGAIDRTGTISTLCLADTTATAFCSGFLRPRIRVTTGLVERLSPTELDAVLLHEAEHARRRDPLRRLVFRSLADAGFLFPLLAWWAAHEQEQSELRADRAAVAAVGARPVAAALLALDTPAHLAGAAGFEGAGAARVAQLLGDDHTPQPPSLPMCLVSLTNVTILVSLAMCVGQDALAHL
ncbi:M56 family metallopeptidase [Nocardia sp. NBC_01388]|uniref:M56 family metallopeptidase n=1 Tax=Nocardia sp. NBC_01388 TaxID=2903596 RepID=UPI00325557BA